MIAVKHLHTETKEEKLTRLYREVFPRVAAFISKSGGNFEQARDIFHEALILFWEKQHSDNDSVIKDEALYIKGISKHLWYRNFRDKVKTVNIDELQAFDIPEEQEPAVSARLLQYVTLSGKRCMDLLKAFYYDKLNMKAVAETMGFGSERSATVQKYKCIEKIRTVVRDRKIQKEDFYD